jgi:hypothetical protein
MAVVSPNAAVPSPVPAALSVPGGAGCNLTEPYAVSAAPGQTVLTVGAGMEFQTIGAAVAAAVNGDLILVQPGTYVNDFADITAQITIAGAGGMVDLVATEPPPNEKGIFVVDSSCVIDNVSFQGAAIADDLGANAAGIRYQGGNLVLHNDVFIDNQNGILAAAVDNLPQNTVTILDSTFDANGESTGPNAGYTHNCYISTGISSLVARNDIFEQANIGHELKSRAASNLINDNIFYDGPTGTASYSIDLPNGGADTVSGNVIEKGPNSQNDAIIHFGGEGIPYSGSALDVTGNRFINDLGPQAVAVLNQTTLNVSITGNEFDNFTNAALGSGMFTQSGNWDQTGAPIAPTASNVFAPGTDVDDFSNDSLPHSVTLTTAMGVRGGGGLLQVNDQAGHVTVLGGAGGLYFVEAPGLGGSYIATAAGAHDTVVAPGQDVVQAEGHDSITGGAGNLTVQVDGAASIASGTGDNAYVVNGAASITGHGGSDTVQVNQAGASARVGGNEAYFQGAVDGGTLALAFAQGNAPAQATITGGAAVRIYGGGMNVTTAGGTSGASIVFGAGTVTACLSAGPDTIHAGSGADDIIVSANAQVYAGSGALSVYGRSETGIATVYGAGGTVLISGDTGDIFYQGGSQRNTVQAALSNITLAGGSGLMDVLGGSRQTVTGGSGGLIFTTSGGADSITTQAAAHDTININNICTLVSNGTDLISAGNGNSTITANGTASITGSTGAAFYVLNGHDTLAAYGYTRATVGGAGAATVSAYGSLTSLMDAGGRLVFSQLANHDGETATITGGATLWASAQADQTDIALTARGALAVLGGGQQSVSVIGGTRVQGGSGADSVAVDAGGAVLQGGSGTLNVSMYDWVDTVATTVFGGSGTADISMGYGNVIFSGGGGAADIAGSYSAETVAAGSGNITLQGGNGGTVFSAGSGNAVVTLTPGGGTIKFGSGHTVVTEASYGTAVLYDFTAGAGGGTDVINQFHTGTDQLNFSGVSVTQDNLINGSTQLVLSDGTQITLNGVSLMLPQAH